MLYLLLLAVKTSPYEKKTLFVIILSIYAKIKLFLLKSFVQKTQHLDLLLTHSFWVSFVNFPKIPKNPKNKIFFCFSNCTKYENKREDLFLETTLGKLVLIERTFSKFNYEHSLFEQHRNRIKTKQFSAYLLTLMG